MSLYDSEFHNMFLITVIDTLFAIMINCSFSVAFYCHCVIYWMSGTTTVCSRSVEHDAFGVSANNAYTYALDYTILGPYDEQP